MRIAIPTAQGRLCMHFGHCEQFTLIDVDDTTQSVQNTTTVTPPHEPGMLPRWLGNQNVNMVIAGGMGQRALQLFQQQGIDVVTGAASDQPRAIVEAWLRGSLETGANVCDH